MTYRADFDVRGHPKGQPRPQAFSMKDKKTGKSVARLRTKGTAESWKSDIVAAGDTWRPRNPLEEAIHVDLVFWMPRPKRLMRQSDPISAIHHDCKPDIDNLVKAVLDALTNDGWWRDDCQVAKVTATKMYHGKLGSPGAQITIVELEPEPAPARDSHLVQP